MGHTSAADKFEELMKRYVPDDPTRRVLEPGSYLVQDGYQPEDRYRPDEKVGGFRHHIEQTGKRGVYIGLDLKPGTNVDIVADDPLHWPIADESFDLVISGQCMEHVDDLPAFMSECYRVLVPGGMCVHVAPSAGPYHAFPIHCWLIMKDGMRWLFDKAGFEILECDQWDKHPWNDCWGVGRKPVDA